jgi:hypothetical protein
MRMLYMEPCTTANQITLEYARALMEMKSPRLGKRHRQNGTYHYTTYHLLSY